jgi:ribonuclease R
MQERAAIEIERAADDIARCFLLERERGERVWDGEVVGLIGAGVFVAFGEGYEGMLPVRRLRGERGRGASEWWELNELRTILEGTRAGGAIRLGDPIRVRVESVDAVRGRVDLERA